MHPWPRFRLILALAAGLMLAGATVRAQDGSLDDVRARGELRHLGIRYANFVTGAGDGLEVDLVRLFAQRLGVRYVFVESDWSRIIPDLLGAEVRRDGDRVTLGDPVPRRGDLIATGMTVLPWRARVLAFSRPTFPTQIWLVTGADSRLQPVTPSSDPAHDIVRTRRCLDGLTVLTKPNTCLDPGLYGLAEAGAHVVTFDDQLKFMAPAVLSGRAEATILDVPDALVAMRHYPGRIKVIGPVSPPQDMAAAFAPDAVALRDAYDAFLAALMSDGTYRRLVDRYYPAVHAFFPAYFAPEDPTP